MIWAEEKQPHLRYAACVGPEGRVGPGVEFADANFYYVPSVSGKVGLGLVENCSESARYGVSRKMSGCVHEERVYRNNEMWLQRSFYIVR